MNSTALSAYRDYNGFLCSGKILVSDIFNEIVFVNADADLHVTILNLYAGKNFR